jgi:hypothetical protein
MLNIQFSSVIGYYYWVYTVLFLVLESIVATPGLKSQKHTLFFLQDVYFSAFIYALYNAIYLYNEANPIPRLRNVSSSGVQG